MLLRHYNIFEFNLFQFLYLLYQIHLMHISLDQQIRKDKQRDRNSSRHRQQHRGYNNQRNRYNNDRQDRYSRQDRPVREPRYVIHITNLHYSVTREQLQQICQNLGKVKSCRIEWDKMGRSNEKATVQYFSKAESQAAVQKLRGSIIEQQAIEAQLMQQDSGPAKRHDIRKNYGSRFQPFSNNFKPGHKHK